MKPSHLRYRNPLSIEQHEGLFDAALACLSGEVCSAVDVGCGKGEVLARLRELRAERQLADLEVRGIDPDGEAIALAAQRHATLRNDTVPAAGEAQWLCRGWQADDTPALAFDLAICMGSRHAFGTTGEARALMLEQLARTTQDGGALLIADGYWRQPPPADYLAATGLQAEELIPLATWHELFEAHQLAICHEELTSEDDFESYERIFWAQGGEHWEKWSQAFLRWGKQTMGFAGWVLTKR